MKTQKGFTLIELLVVISIIGILSSIVVVGLDSAKTSSRDARRIADIKNIQLALALYYQDNGHYPCRLSDQSVSSVAGCSPQFSGTYMNTIPTDPLSSSVSAIDYKYSGLVQTNFNDGLAPCSLGVRSYHLGAVMENSSGSYMSQDDVISTAVSGHITINGLPYIRCNSSLGNFHGDAPLCVGTSPAGVGVGETCYSVGPQ